MTQQALEAEEMVDEALETAEQEGQESAEDRARKFGWKPKEEYKGKGEWVDAEAFLENTETDPQVLKNSLRNLERNYTKLEKTTEAILQHQHRQLEDARKQAYEQAERDIQARYLAAVEEGDIEGANKAWAAKDVLSKRKLEETTYRPAEDHSEVVQAWVDRNKWYSEDVVLSDYAAKYEDSLAKRGIGFEEEGRAS